MTEVLINKENSTIILTLNRERVLNALNLNMVRIIYENISYWNDDDSISGILLRGEGEKAFCAGVIYFRCIIQKMMKAIIYHMIFLKKNIY